MDSEIRKNLLSKLIVKKNLYLLYSVIDIISAIVVAVEFSNYYSLVLFGMVLLYFVIQFVVFQKIINQEEYVAVKLRCDEVKMSPFGYSLTNSKVYDFTIQNIEGENPKIFCDNWIKKYKIDKKYVFSDKTQLQFAYNMKLSDLKKANREKNQKYSNGDEVYMLFMTNRKKPLCFTNATLLVY